MLRFIAMTCGYVESSRTSTLIYECEFFGNPGYSSYKEAITDLALDLYSKYYDDYHSYENNIYKGCCRKTLTSNKEAKFCSECGSNVTDKTFDYEQFMQYVTNLHDSTCDTYGESESTSTRYLCWWPWTNKFIGAPKEDVIVIAENAQVVLLQALLDAKPELKNQEEDKYYNYLDADWNSFKNEKQPSY